MSTRYVITSTGEGYPASIRAVPTKELIPGVPDILIGIAIGTLILGPIIWTGLGRMLAYKAMSKAYKISEKEIREKVEKW